MTFDEAVAMIAEKAAKGDGGKKPFRGKGRKKRRERLGAKHFRTQGPTATSDAGRQRAAKADFRPSREDILRFIEENPDRSGKRDIAKAFSLKGDDRIWLKDLLRDLQDEGLLQKDRKRLIRPGALPHVVVLDVFGTRRRGRAAGQAAEYHRRRTGADRFDPRAARRRRSCAGRRRPAARQGVPDRRDLEGLPIPAASSASSRSASEAVLGVFRIFKDGTFRIEPVERRQPELIVEPEFRGDAKDGDLVEVEPSRAGRYGLPRGKVIAVLGSLTSEKAVSMIAIHAHDIPHIFPASGARRGRGGEAGDAWPTARTGASCRW